MCLLNILQHDHSCVSLKLQNDCRLANILCAFSARSSIQKLCLHRVACLRLRSRPCDYPFLNNGYADTCTGINSLPCNRSKKQNTLILFFRYPMIFSITCSRTCDPPPSADVSILANALLTRQILTAFVRRLSRLEAGCRGVRGLCVVQPRQ